MRKKMMVVLFLLLIFHFGCEKEVSVTELEEHGVAVVKINSIPEGASVYVNGRISGFATPTDDLMLLPGEHSITLKKKYFLDYETTLNVERDDTVFLDADYFTIPNIYGEIICKSIPSGAGIIFDGDTLNLSTPVKLTNIIPGEHELGFYKNDHRTAHRNLSVYSDTRIEINTGLTDTSLIVIYNLENSALKTNYFNSIFNDGDGRIWIGSSAGLHLYTNGDFKVYNKENSILQSNAITTLLNAIDGSLWVGTSNGLIKINGNNWVFFSESNGGPAGYITSLAEKKDGSIIVGTDNGVYEQAGFGFRKIEQIVFPGNYVTALNINSSGLMLVGTNYFGVGEYRNGEFNFLKRDSLDIDDNEEDNHEAFTLLDNSIVGLIGLDSKENFWISYKAKITNGKLEEYPGMCKYDGENSYDYPEITISNSFMLDARNNILITGDEGLYVIKGEGDIVDYKSFEEYSHWKSSAVTYDNNDYFWIATFGGGIVKIKDSENWIW